MATLDSLVPEQYRPYIHYCAETTQTYDISHDVHHHIKVLNNVLTNVPDDEVRQLAGIVACLHDILDSKYTKDLPSDRAKLTEFLTVQLPPSTLITPENVIWIIEHMSFSKESKFGKEYHLTPEVNTARDLAADADRLEALGVIGLQRMIDYAYNQLGFRGLDKITTHIHAHTDEKIRIIHQRIYHPAMLVIARKLQAELLEIVDDPDRLREHLLADVRFSE